MAGQRRPRPAGEQFEAIVQALQYLFDRESARPHRCQLDSERHAVEAAADARHGGLILAVELERARGCARPLCEQLHGLVVAEFSVGARPNLGERQRRDRGQEFTRDRQWLSTGGDYPNGWCRAEHRCQDVSNRLQQMLTVVHYQQQLALLEIGEDEA